MVFNRVLLILLYVELYKDEQRYSSYIKSRYFDAEPDLHVVEDVIKAYNLEALVK